MHEITGLRPPDDRDVEPAVIDVLDHPLCCGLRTVDGKPDDVRHDAAAHEREGCGGRGHVGADELHADGGGFKPRIVEGFDWRCFVAPIDEHVAGSVISGRRGDAFHSRRHAGEHVASPCVERLANDAPAQRLPAIVELGADLVGDESRNTVLEAAFVRPRIRQVVGIGAYDEVARGRLPGEREQNEREHDGQQITAVRRHTTCLPWLFVA